MLPHSLDNFRTVLATCNYCAIEINNAATAGKICVIQAYFEFPNFTTL